MRFRKLLAALMVASMVLGLIGSAAFAQSSEQALYDEAVAMLREFGIVQGDAGTGELRPNDSITRAEMIKILVTAAGQGEVAALLAGAPAFSDSQNHWASGYIALAKNMGLTTGYPDGTFRPDAEVTYAEVVALLTRLAGVQPAAGTWPMNYIQAAIDAGINAANMDLAGLANAAAVRGAVFVLSHSAFMNVTDSSGKNVYQKSFDSDPPSITVDAVSSPTEAASVTVSGKAGDAVSAFVNGSAVELAADGSFSATVDLKVGANDIVITALDLVGNEGSATVAVERVNAPAAAIEASAIEVVAGESAEVAATVKDQNGAAIEGAEITGVVAPEGLGTYAAGTFTAGTATGTGTLTLSYGDVSTEVAVTVTPGPLVSITVVPSKSVAAPGELVTMSVKGADANGNEVAVSDVQFSVDGTDALINPSNGNFIASKAGSYTITATSGDLSGTATVGIFGGVAGVKVEGPDTVVANGKTEATFTVIVVDANGNQVVTDAARVSLTYGDAIAVKDWASGDHKAVKGGQVTFVVTGVVGNAGVVESIDIAVDPDGGDDFDPDDDMDTSVDIELLEQVPSAIKFVANESDKFLVANAGGETADVVFQVVDQEGVAMKEGDWDVAFEVSGPATLEVDETVTDPDAKATATVKSKKGQTGTVTVTATVEGVGSASATVQAAVAGSAAKIELAVTKDEQVADGVGRKDENVLKITITDANGVPVKAGSEKHYEVKLKFDSGDGDLDVAAGDNVDSITGDPGEKERVVIFVDEVASATVELSSTKAKKFTVTATETTDNALKSASANASFSFVAGDADDVKWDNGTTWTAVTTREGQNKATLKLQVTDAKGNAVKKSGVTYTLAVKQATFEDAGDGQNGADTRFVLLNGKEETAKVTTDANGVATVEIEARRTGYYYVEVTDSDPEDLADFDEFAPIMVVNAIPNEISVKVTNLDGGTFTSIDAGERIVVTVSLKDGDKLPITDDDAIKWLQLEVADDAFALDEPPVSADDAKPASEVKKVEFDNAGDGYTAELTTLAAGSQTVRVNVVGLPVKLSGTKSFTVRPLTTANQLSVTLKDGASSTTTVDGTKVKGKVTVEEGSSTSFAVQLVDSLGNAVSLTANKKVTVFLYGTASDAEALDVDNDLELLVGQNPDIQVRTTQNLGGVDQFDLRSSRTLWLVNTDADDYDRFLIGLTPVGGETTWIEVEVD